EATRTEQRGIENIRTVRRGDQDDAVVGLEAIHLDEQLFERLLSLVVAAAKAGTAVSAYSINFVYENDARGVGFPLLEQIAHAARAHAGGPPAPCVNSTHNN